MRHYSYKHAFGVTLTVCCLLMVAITHAAQRLVIQKNAKSKDVTLCVTNIETPKSIEDQLLRTLKRIGWFQLKASPEDADYSLNVSLKASNQGLDKALNLSVTRSDDKVMQLFTPVRTDSRTTVYAAVDSLLQNLLQVPGLCQSKLAFVVGKGATKEIFTSNFDGSNPTRLTHNGSISTEPAWSSNSPELLYTLYQNHRTSIVKIDTSRSAQKRLATYPGLNASAEFSNNGKKIALCLSRDGKLELYTTAPDGTNPLRLTKDRSVESSPCWSPDDRLICFVSDRSGRPNLYLIPSDGGTPRRLLRDSFEAVSPDWSPVSNLLSFAIRRSGGYRIAIMDMNKPSNERKITVLTESGNWQSPSWAPDGRHLICSRQVGQKYELCMIDVHTGKITKLTKPANIALPNWSTLLPR